jgi:hypothetical protein
MSTLSPFLEYDIILGIYAIICLLIATIFTNKLGADPFCYLFDIEIHNKFGVFPRLQECFFYHLLRYLVLLPPILFLSLLAYLFRHRMWYDEAFDFEYFDFGGLSSTQQKWRDHMRKR